MEEVLEKIRPHVKSALMNQSGPAKLLVAVETTLKEEGQESTPVAYYASFFATLQESVKREESGSDLNLEDGSVVPSTLYLLSLVLPHVPHAVVRSNMSSLLTVVAPLFPLISSSAPPLRSATGIVAAIIEALDAPHLTSSSPLPRQSFATVLELTIDPRPKVRKRAQEAVIRIINYPPPPMLIHPYSRQTADFVIGKLNIVAGNPGQQDSADMGIWLSTFTKAIASSWPSTVSQIIPTCPCTNINWQTLFSASRRPPSTSPIAPLPFIAISYIPSLCAPLCSAPCPHAHSPRPIHSKHIAHIFALTSHTRYFMARCCGKCNGSICSCRRRCVFQGSSRYLGDELGMARERGRWL